MIVSSSIPSPIMVSFYSPSKSQKVYNMYIDTEYTYGLSQCRDHSFILTVQITSCIVCGNIFNRLIVKVAEKLQKKVLSGMDLSDVWNEVSADLVRCAQVDY